MSKTSLTCQDPGYFKNYAGSGKSYNQVWNEYSYASDLVTLLKKVKIINIKKILVLGAATGKVLETFEEGLSAKTWGCEINEWAHSQIPAKFKRRIKRMDMRDYVKICKHKNQHFDLVFTNSLIYLQKRELLPILKMIADLGGLIHFHSSFLGNSCKDPYRNILETYDWWNRCFNKAGFSELKMGRKRSYLWMSPKFLAST